MKFEEESMRFVRLCIEHEVEFLLVGGAAVNFYGYKRHSADIDIWIKPNQENFDKILFVLQKLDYLVNELPRSVIDGNQNISIKISPEQEIEIITRFNPNKTFDEAYSEASDMQIGGAKIRKIKVISLEGLISSKAKSRRTKDMLDIIELKRIHNI